MSWFSNLFSEGAAKVTDSISKGLDSLFTSDEERLQAKILIEKEINTFKVAQLSALAQYDKEVTKRWTSDNEHFITRMVRPLSFIFVQILFGSIVLLDGNMGEFSVKEAYIPVIEGLMLTMTIAYFGSRGAEKVFKK